MRATEILRVAYRASPPGVARHCVRAELVHLLRGHSGVAVHSGLDRGDDIARPADLLRPARHGSVRSRSRRAHCRRWSNGPTASPRCSTISAVGKRSSSRSTALSPRRRYSRRRTPPVRRRWSCSSAMRPYERPRSIPRSRPRSWSAMWGTGEIPTCRSIQTCRGTKRSGQRGHEWNAWRPARRRSPSCCRSCPQLDVRAVLPISPRADPRRPPLRRRADRARNGQVRRRPHTRREIR